MALVGVRTLLVSIVFAFGVALSGAAPASIARAATTSDLVAPVAASPAEDATTQSQVV